MSTMVMTAGSGALPGPVRVESLAASGIATIPPNTSDRRTTKNLDAGPQIPTVDLAKIRSTNEEERRSCAEVVREAASNWGMMQIRRRSVTPMTSRRGISKATAASSQTMPTAGEAWQDYFFHLEAAEEEVGGMSDLLLQMKITTTRLAHSQTWPWLHRAQHGSGLQAYYAGEWVTVGCVPDSIIVHVGDVIEILSNGRYKSILHRVLVNREKVRISWSVFCEPPPDKIILKPLDALVHEGRRLSSRLARRPAH
ncbi:unnamed protein product [Spirodela intermedia]|uniref:Isopenicillin N synthase-like Fe(2+) 2OG dioxygenase domain-containing protein n=1 Tax=Spirodela intermedia TaxID=51605 RepID=A0ABN7EB95_SPIIN|nr:unnamed protein product [Spirodela intermedia]